MPSIFKMQMPAQPMARPSAPNGAVGGLNRAIGGARGGGGMATGAQRLPPDDGAGGPGDSAMWQENPLGQRFQWHPRDINGQGDTWQAVGQTPEQEEIQRHTADMREQDNAHNRQREEENYDQTLSRRYMIEDEARRRAMLKEDISTINTPGPTLARVPGGDSGDDEAAALAFGRAKDQAGLATRGLLKSVQHNAAVRGIGGSGIEGGASMEALSGGADRVANAGLQQAIAKAQRGHDVADRDYSGNIAQRGQDIQQQQAAQERRQRTIELMTRMYGGAY